MASAQTNMEESEREKEVLHERLKELAAAKAAPQQEEVDSVVRDSPLFRKGDNPKNILKGLSQGQDTPRLLIRAVAKTGQEGAEVEDEVNSEPTSRALFDEGQDDRDKVIEELTEACENLVQEREAMLADRESMLAETLNLLEEGKRECSAESEAESARIRNDAIALILKMKSHWYRTGKEQLLDFALCVGLRIKVQRAFVRWRVAAERGRRVMLGRKFAGALSDAGGELVVKSPLAPKPERPANPFGLVLDDDPMVRAAKLEESYATTLRETAAMKEEAK